MSNRATNAKLLILGFIILFFSFTTSFAQTVFTVTSTLDSGPGTLRDAIDKANAVTGSETVTIKFDNSMGIMSIAYSGTYYPEITRTVTIDGLTSMGSENNLYGQQNSATCGVILNKSLLVNAPNCVVKGIKFSSGDYPLDEYAYLPFAITANVYLMKSAKNCQVIYNEFDLRSSLLPIFVEGAKNLISNNKSVQGGFELKGAHLIVVKSDSNTISNNYLDRFWEGAIVLKNANRNFIKRNVVGDTVGFKSSTGHGIVLLNANENSIDSNLIVRCSGAAVLLRQSSKNSVTNNYMGASFAKGKGQPGFNFSNLGESCLVIEGTNNLIENNISVISESANILLYNTSACTVRNNKIACDEFGNVYYKAYPDNSYYATYGNSGILISDCNTDITIEGNDLPMQGIRLINSSNIVFKGNRIGTDKTNGYFVNTHGISINSSDSYNTQFISSGFMPGLDFNISLSTDFGIIPDNITIEDNDISCINGSPIFIGTETKNFKVIGNRIGRVKFAPFVGAYSARVGFSTTSHGIYFSNSYSSTIENNMIESVKAANIYLQSCSGFTIKNNTLNADANNYNSFHGVYITGAQDAGYTHLIESNSIKNCKGSAIALDVVDNATVTKNTFSENQRVILPTDAAPYTGFSSGISLLNSANKNKLKPVITLAKAHEKKLYVEGTCEAGDKIELFSNDNIAGNAIEYISSTTANGVTSFKISMLLNGKTPPSYLVATATDNKGNTSELSDVFTVDVCSITVINVNDAGAGSLRSAIDCANSFPGLDTLIFNIPAGLADGSGKFIINLNTELKATDSIGIIAPVNGLNEPLVILNNSAGASTNGLVLFNSHGSSVKNLEVKNFYEGILITNSKYSKIENSYLHDNTDVSVEIRGVCDSTKILSNRIENNNYGFRLSGGPNGAVIGEKGKGNLIKNNNTQGLACFASPSYNIIQYNIIQGNKTDGISLNAAASNNIIRYNEIIENSRNGIYILSGCQDNLVYTNFIGVDKLGNAHGNSGNGVQIDNYTGNTVKQNTIAYNKNGIGVGDLSYTYNNTLSQNIIFNNTQLAINLYLTSSNPGNNSKTSSRLLSSYNPVASGIQIEGRSAPGDTVEVFVSNGKPQNTIKYLGKAKAAADSSWSYIVSYAEVPDSGKVNIVTTSTDLLGNTSELSKSIKVLYCITCPCIVTNNNDSGPGSLREAINCANAKGLTATVPTTITFNILGTGDQLIKLSTILPDILYSTNLDGSTQSGKVIIDGGSVGSSVPVFNFKNGLANQSSKINQISFINSTSAANSNQRSLSINNSVFYKCYHAIDDDFKADTLIITNSNYNMGNSFLYFYNNIPKFVKVQNTKIDSCSWRGINSTSTSTHFQIENNSITNCQSSGISLSGANKAEILNNYIASNAEYGVYFNLVTNLSTVKGNTIGLSIDKQTARPNSTGLYIQGGLAIVDSNYVGGNLNVGINIQQTAQVSISRNYIGTTSTWKNLGNGKTGVYATEYIKIGGSTLDSANFIGYNGEDGVSLGFTGGIVQNNYIGVSPIFTNMGNVKSGIKAFGQDHKYVGNFIGYNGENGIDDGFTGSLFLNNKIGGDGVNDFPNNQWGISSHNIIVSENGKVKNNIIANNLLGGVYLEGEKQNISQNIFIGNQPLAISLNGGTANKNKQPATFSSFTQASSLTLNGSGEDGDTVEVFYNKGIVETALKYAGYAVVTGGVWTLTVPQGPAFDPTKDNYYVNTASDTDGNTSQLSTLFKVNCIVCPCIVTNTNDSGLGSLREAINCANAKNSHADILFAIPGAGPYSIFVVNPIIVTTQYGVTLNGKTQINSGAGAGADQSIIIKASPIIMPSTCGPSIVRNLSFLNNGYGVMAFSDSITVDSNQFNNAGVRFILDASPAQGYVNVRNNNFKNTSLAFQGENINGLRLEDNSVLKTPAGMAYIIRYSNDVLVQNNKLDSVQSGIQVSSSNQVKLFNNNITSANVGGYGITLQTCKQVSVNNNVCDGLHGQNSFFTGIILNACNDGSVKDNNITGVIRGITYDGISKYVLDKNTIRNYGDGILCASGSGANLQITNNNLYNGIRIGIGLNVDTAQVFNNIIDTCATGIYTVHNNGALSKSSVHDNQVYHFNTVGIDIGQGSDNDFYNNAVGNGVGDGIGIYRGHTNLSIRNNFIGITPQLASAPIQGYGIYMTMTNVSGGPLMSYNHIGNIRIHPDNTLGTYYTNSGSGIFGQGGADKFDIVNNYIGIDSLGQKQGIDSSCIYRGYQSFSSVIVKNKLGNAFYGVRLKGIKDVLVEDNILTNISKGIDLFSDVSTTESILINRGSFKNMNAELIDLHYNSVANVANLGKTMPTIDKLNEGLVDVTVIGKSEPGDLVQVYRGAASNDYDYIDKISADGSGDWQLKVLSKLPATNFFRATGTNTTQNNTSELSVYAQFCNQRLNTLPASLSICTNDSTAVNAGITANNYNWKFNGVNFANTQKIWAKKKGEYILSITDAYGCAASDTITLTEDPLPLASDFLMSSDAGKNDPVVVVDINFGFPDSLSWDFGKATVKQDGQKYIISYTEVGTYVVKLTSYLGNCSQTTEHYINIGEESKQSDDGYVYPYLIKDVTLGPNPNTGNFTIKASLTQDDNIQIEIFNANGKMVEKRKSTVATSNHQVDYNLANLDPGKYIIRVSCGKDLRILTMIKE